MVARGNLCWKNSSTLSAHLHIPSSCTKSFSTPGRGLRFLHGICSSMSRFCLATITRARLAYQATTTLICSSCHIIPSPCLKILTSLSLHPCTIIVAYNFIYLHTTHLLPPHSYQFPKCQYLINSSPASRTDTSCDDRTVVQSIRKRCFVPR